MTPMFVKVAQWLIVPKPVKPKESELDELARLLQSENPNRLERIAELLGQTETQGSLTAPKPAHDSGMKSQHVNRHANC
jgi:hypothetical protein